MAMSSAPSTAKGSTVKRKKIARGQLLINGRWRDAKDGLTMPTSDPTHSGGVLEKPIPTSGDW
jgi:hypothetical protein